MVMFIFSTPLYFLLKGADRTFGKLIYASVLLIGGFLAMTLALCVASVLIGGHFVFFKHELLTAFLYVATNYYGRPMTDTFQWFSFDAYIPVFLLSAAFSTATLVWLSLQGSVLKTLNLSLPAIVYLAAAALCFGFEFSGRMVLQEGDFLLAVAACVSRNWECVRGRKIARQNTSYRALPDGSVRADLDR